MGTGVNALWADLVDDVKKMGDADFERRSGSLSLQETNGKAPAIADVLGDEWGVSQAKAADRAVRIFLAHLLDTHQDLFPEARKNHDVEILIPPSGWIANFEPISIQYQPGGSHLNISVPPTVEDLVELVVETDEVEIESKADFLRTSLYWVIGEWEDESQETETSVQDERQEDLERRDKQTDQADVIEGTSSYLQTLYISKARQTLTDFFLGLEWTEESRPLTKRDLVDQTGLQRKSIIEHIDVLIELGIVNEVETGRWPQYEPAVEKKPYQAVLETNYILAEYHTEL